MLTLLALSHAASASTLINFEDQTGAPCCWASGVPLTTQYQAPNALTGGPASNGWEILDQSGGFPVSGHSSPKFLAWCNGITSATEDLTFSEDVVNFSIRAGTGSGGTFTATAKNSVGTVLGTTSLTMTTALQTLSLNYSGIRSVTLTAPANCGASDDIRYNRLPTPVATGASGFRNTPITMNGTGSSDADSVNASYPTGVWIYEWDCTGDGVWDTSAVTATGATCSYPSLGTFNARLRVYDSEGYPSPGYTTAPITISNRLPTAVANGPYTGYRNTAITVSAAGSTDADGGIAKYEWDCTNDGVYDTTSATSSASCTYTTLGSFTAKVRVTDNNGGSSTATSAVTINNRLPTAATTGPYTGFRATAIAMNATGSADADGTIATYAWDCTNDGTYDVSGSTVSLNCTYAALGAFTARLRVTDNNGGTATTTTGVTINNRPPVAEANGPYTGSAGSPIPVTGVGSADLDGTITKYEWDCTNDGTYEFNSTTATGISCSYPVSGSYTVGLRVTDNNGAMAIDFATVGINNVPPVAEANGPYTGTRNTPVALSSSGSTDADGSVAKYEWDCTSDGTYDVTNTSGTGLSCTYAAVGTYTARLRVTDNQGNTGLDNAIVTINAIAPTAEAAGPYSGNEGSPVAVTAAGSADTDGTVVSWVWDCDANGSFETSGKTPTCTFPNDGAYVVALRVTDDDGKTAVDSASVTVSNVAPTIATSPSTTTLEGDPYVYDANATDPGADTHTWSLLSGPAGATIDAATGEVDWTPDYGDAIVGGASFEVAVTDGGATVNQSWNVFVTARDDDGDGMWDGWELAEGLSPVNPGDATQDPDADGLTNLDEFTERQDPFSYDGPGVPLPSTPRDGQDATSTPSLIVENADDPQGEDLTYEFEIYEDPDMLALLATEAGVTEGQYTSEWLVTVSLFENDHYYWRARAADAWVDGSWSPLVDFRVNDLNEAPLAITLVYPIDETVDHASPNLEWVQTTDPEGDPVTYDVQVLSADHTTTLASVEGLVAPPPSNGTWTVDTALADGTYVWRVSAKDAVGVASTWSEAEFVVSTDDAAPTGVAFQSPLTDDRVDSVSPVLVATEGIDAEGSVVTYKFEVDGEASFASSQYESFEVAASGTGTVRWDLAADDIVLAENAVAYARVRGIDSYGNASQPDTISFFVVGENEAPVGLSLQSPLDGTLLSSAAPFVVSNAVDPEGLAVTYDFVIASDQALTDVIDEASGVVQGDGGTTSWESTVTIAGEVWWSARAVDADGVASAFAPAWRIDADSGEDTATEPPGKCGCATGGGQGFAIVGLLALLSRRRRK